MIYGDQKYDPNGMVAFQAIRRLVLRCGLSPATGATSPWTRSAPLSSLRPMWAAPRDGTRITLHRRPHPNLKHPVVKAWWKQWSAHHGFWNSALGPLGGDEYMIGWEDEK